jgi:hypothetical protein
LMKSLLLTLGGIFIVFLSVGVAQEQHPPKGYYSIKGKKEQLPAYKKPQQFAVKTNGFPSVSKGYYSMPGHEKQLPEKIQFYLVPKERVAPKGYFSIPGKQ